MPSWRASARRSALSRSAWRGSEHDEQHERRDAEPRPRPAVAVAAREARPPERAGAAEDREDRGGQQQVAAEDRQAGRGEHAEGRDRDDAGRRAEQRRAGAGSASASRPPPAAPNSTGSRRISPSRRGAVSGTSPSPVIARERLRVVARAEQRVQRVAGHREVRQRPQHRRGDGERDEPRIARARRAPQPGEVGDREQPRLRAQQPRDREQGEHRRARARAPRLDEQRAEHERHVRDVDVRAGAEVEHRAPGQDDRGGERAGRRVEPLRAEAVDDPAERAEGGERADERRRSSPPRRARRGPRRCSAGPGARRRAWRAGAAWGRARRRSRARRRARGRAPRRRRRACRS